MIGRRIITLKILSLNINNFSGVNCKKDKKYKSVSAWRESNKENFKRNSDKILEYIQKDEISPDIVVFHEVELDTPTYSVFKEKFKEMNYTFVSYPTPKFKNSSITMMFVKNYIKYYSVSNPHDRNLRASIIKVNDCIIYGVHCPGSFDEDFWEQLIGFYKGKKEEKILIIGDLNIFDSGTEQKKKFCKLLNEGAKDVWIEKGYPHEKSTFNSGKRIDYAIVSPLLLDKLSSIKIDDRLRSIDVTDHSAIIVEV